MDYPNLTQGRLIHPQKRTFWTWAIEGKRLTTSSGKVGKAGRVTAKNYPDRMKAEKDLEAKHYAKLGEGYQFLQSENPGPLALQTWIANQYTGFHSLDLDVERNWIAVCRHTGRGQKLCEILILDAATGAIQKLIKLKEFDVSTLRFFAGNVVIQADDRVLELDLATGTTCLLGADGVFPHLDFDLQNGRLLHSTAKGKVPVIQVLDLATRKILLDLDASDQRRVTDHHIRHVGVLSPSGKMAAICRRPGEIELHDVRKKSCRYLRGEFPCVTKLQFHPSEQWLAFTELYEDWRFRLWRIADGLEDSRFDALEYTYPDGTQRPQECFDFAFSPQGNVALRDGDWIRVHDFETLRTIARLQQRHVVKSWGTGGLHLLFAGDHRLLTRTDRAIVSVYDLGEESRVIS
jgi:predicted DNA-binding WGR domain protein